MLKFPHLFSPLQLRNVWIANRILSTGHDTDLGRDGLPGDELIAYQRARAKGGAGLIIVQVVGVHETARYTAEVQRELGWGNIWEGVAICAAVVSLISFIIGSGFALAGVSLPA